MKVLRSTLVGVVLAVAAALAFLYAVPSGRTVRREALRALRRAGNITGLHPLPILRVKTWTGRRGVLLIEVYESGRTVVSGRGDSIDAQLTPDAARAVIESGRLALGDFSGDGCGTMRGGVSAELYVLIDGAWVGSVCRDASEWPRGAETRRLLDQLGSHVAGLPDRW